MAIIERGKVTYDSGVEIVSRSWHTEAMTSMSCLFVVFSGPQARASVLLLIDEQTYNRKEEK